MNAYQNPGKYTARGADYTVAAVAGAITQSTDVAQIDIRDLQNVTLLMNQTVDGGTATLHFDASADGVNWVPDIFTSKADSNFAAGANQSLQIGTLSDANGMPILYQALRIRCTASTAGGTYTATVTGVQRTGWSG